LRVLAVLTRSCEAEEIFPPSHNIGFNQKDSRLQVKNKTVALLSCYDVLGSGNFQFGRADQPGHIWISSLEPCNLSCSVQEERIIFWFGLNIENKDAINHIFSKFKVKELYKFFSELPSDYRVWLARFAYYRPKKYEQEVERLSQNQSSKILHPTLPQDVFVSFLGTAIVNDSGYSYNLFTTYISSGATQQLNIWR